MLLPWDPLGKCREGMGIGVGGTMGQGRNNTKFRVRMTQVQVPPDALVASSSLASHLCLKCPICTNDN